MRGLGRRWCFVLLVAASPVRAEDLAQERARVAEAMERERGVLEALRDAKGNVLEVLELVEVLHKASRAERRAYEAERRSLAFQRELAEEKERAVRQRVRELAERLAPRLEASYRLSREKSLGLLMSASDFSSFVRRNRGLKALLQGELRLLGELEVALTDEAAMAALAREWEGRLGAHLEEVQERVDRAQKRQAVLAELLGSLQRQASESADTLRELEQQDKRLATLVAKLEAKSRAEGLRAKKGKLLFPADGLVEVGFGRVVNPKFNTVTIQKGLDIRAPFGSVVRSVAAGTVAYAAYLRGLGNLIIVDHGQGFHSLMAHLDEFFHSPGDEVEAGEALGIVGDTGSLKGAYVYFELRFDGEAIDPSGWLEEPGQRERGP